MHDVAKTNDARDASGGESAKGSRKPQLPPSTNHGTLTHRYENVVISIVFATPVITVVIHEVGEHTVAENLVLDMLNDTMTLLDWEMFSAPPLLSSNWPDTVYALVHIIFCAKNSAMQQ